MKMYTSAPRRSRRPLLGFALLLLAAIAPTHADEPPPFSPRVTVFFSPFVHKDGATLYRAVCQGCHMPDAKGASGAGSYPALAANPKLASAAYPAITVVHGRHGMPAFADYLSDAQVAEVVNYVRTHFDNHYADALSADDVKKLRATP
ncbi:MAG TPA: cytochrome c [Rudaea sp.]|uniref:c-type cytochrome n=1 Tax=Rudaea sp. TaxID=2136325 RepID=UPI002F9333EE